MMVGILFSIHEKSLDFRFGTFGRRVREGTGLSSALKRMQMEIDLLLIFGKQFGYGRWWVRHPPGGGEWIGWLNLERSHIGPTRHQMREIGRLAIHRKVGELGDLSG